LKSYDRSLKQIDFFKDIFIVDVVCGLYHCLSISNKGEIYSCGDNYDGQLGNGESGMGKIPLIPIKIYKI
jgi:alpha-tubulin suppressor-like RCC1 family protein